MSALEGFALAVSLKKHTLVQVHYRDTEDDEYIHKLDGVWLDDVSAGSIRVQTIDSDCSYIAMSRVVYVGSSEIDSGEAER